MQQQNTTDILRVSAAEANRVTQVLEITKAPQIYSHKSGGLTISCF